MAYKFRIENRPEAEYGYPNDLSGWLVLENNSFDDDGDMTYKYFMSSLSDLIDEQRHYSESPEETPRGIADAMSV